MQEVGVSLAVIAEALRRRRRLLLAATVVGAVLGVLLHMFVLKTVYTATTDVVLQGPIEPSRGLTEAQIATSTAVLSQVSAALPDHPSLNVLVKRVSASAETGGVVQISVDANSLDEAKRLAGAVTDRYVSYTSGLLQQASAASATALALPYGTLTKQMAQTEVEINDVAADPAQKATGPVGDAARAKLADLQSVHVTEQNNMQELQTQIAKANSDAANPNIHYQVTGQPNGDASPSSLSAHPWWLIVPIPVVAVPLFCAFIIVVLRRRDLRLYDATLIERVARAPVLGQVGGGDPADEMEALRYRRVARRLVAEAGGDPVPSVTLIHLASDVTGGDAARRLFDLIPSGTPVHRISATRTLPDLEPGTRAALVVSAGTLSAVTLRELVSGCRDAGAEPFGVVFVESATSRRQRSAEPSEVGL